MVDECQDEIFYFHHFVIFFSDKFTNAKSFHFGFGNFHVFVKKKTNKLCQRPSDPLYMTFCCLLFTSQSFLLKPNCPIITNLDETVSLETNFKSLYFCQFLTINQIWHILTKNI